MNNIIVEDPIILDMIKDRRNGLSILEKLVKAEIKVDHKLVRRIRYYLFAIKIKFIYINIIKILYPLL